MPIAELIDVLETHDPNAVVVLADSAGEKENSGWRACGSERYSRPTFTGSSARVCPCVHYPGLHVVALVVNCRTVASASFQLLT